MTDGAKKALRQYTEKCTSALYERRYALAFGGTVFLFGLVPISEMYPFGFALYIAGDKHHGAGLAGLICSVLVCNTPVLYLPVSIGLYAFKKISDGRISGKGIDLLAALTAAAFLWASKAGQSFYALANSSAVLALLPLFTVLYGFCFSERRCKPTMRHGGMTAMLFTVLLLVYKLFGHPLFPLTAALFFALAASTGGGMLYGGLYGFVCGLSGGSACAAICTVTGLITGLLASEGQLISASCGAFAGFCTGLYFFGLDNVAWLVAAYVFASAAYGAFYKKLGVLPFGTITVRPNHEPQGRSPFAEAFFAISQNARKAAANETEAARTADPYACISGMLNAAAEKREAEICFDSRLSAQASAVLFGAGIRADSVRVIGGRRKQLIAEGVILDRMSLSTTELKKLMSAAVGAPMQEPKLYPQGGKARLVMESAPSFRIECSRTGCPKKGEELCGDTVSFFSGEGGYFYALISDGMGSGKTAASCSRLASVFLEKLLEAGADRRSALSLLNSFLASRDEEVFATVDLFEADLYTGKGIMVKAGAAPSFILREGNCSALHSETAPAGIIRDIGAEQLSFDMKDGDTLIMLSDGVAEVPEYHETVSRVLSSASNCTTAMMADKLLSESVKQTGRRDDMSVCVIKILAA